MVAFDRSTVAEANWLATHHRAMREGRARWISSLPLRARSAALDVGCGEGAFSADIAADNRIRSLCLTDADKQKLDKAISTCATLCARLLPSQSAVCDAAALPFADASFDVTFCMNVLEYVGDTTRAIRELARVTKADGLVALKDEDAFRDLILPWPIDIEIELNRAWADVLKSRPPSCWKPDAGRNLLQWVFSAGFPRNMPQLIVHDVAAPLTIDQESYIRSAFANYLDEYRSRLRAETFEELCRRLSIGAHCNEVPEWLRQPSFRFQSLEYVVLFSPGGDPLGG